MQRVVLLAGAAAALAVAPAIAADDHAITASNYAFTPSTITIAPGDTVVFGNSEGEHNFAFEDGPAYPATPTGPGPAWEPPPRRTFTDPGVYRFRCELHPDDMTGVITVVAATPTPTPTATPAPAPPPGGPPAPGTGPGGPVLRSVTLAARRFCVRRRPACRRPGVRLRIDLAAPAPVRGVLRRSGRRFGRVSFGTVAAGTRTLRFQRTACGRRLKRGRYTLALTVAGERAPLLRFRVR